ncbi:MAG: prevent-host-death protein [bacterium]|nr:prevent-host-death protein [bacterium]
MPNILPVSELRNYNQVLKSVDNSGRVYLTRNGHGAYAIMTIAEADALDRLRAAHNVVADLREAEARAELEGWVTDEDIQEIMELDK